jgi:hypothetical protein
MLLGGAAVLHDLDPCTVHGAFDPRFDLFQRFHDEKPVIPSEVEGFRNIA